MHFDGAAVWNQIRLAGSQWDADARKRLLQYLESFRVQHDEKDHPPNALDHCAKSKGPVCFKSYAQHKPSGLVETKTARLLAVIAGSGIFAFALPTWTKTQRRTTPIL